MIKNSTARSCGRWRISARQIRNRIRRARSTQRRQHRRSACARFDERIEVAADDDRFISRALARRCVASSTRRRRRISLARGNSTHVNLIFFLREFCFLFFVDSRQWPQCHHVVAHWYHFLLLTNLFENNVFFIYIYITKTKLDARLMQPLELLSSDDATLSPTSSPSVPPPPPASSSSLPSSSFIDDTSTHNVQLVARCIARYRSLGDQVTKLLSIV